MLRRLFAVIFIAIIVLGNVWFGQAAFGGTVSNWVPASFMFLMLLAFVVGLAMAVLSLVSRLRSQPDQQP
jgi:TRAP-type C4-dicarboxylate transport system permease small subunit